MVPPRTYSLGRFLSAGASLRRLAYSSSMRSILYGAHPQPASRNATRSRGNFSGTPSKIIELHPDAHVLARLRADAPAHLDDLRRRARKVPAAARGVPRGGLRGGGGAGGRPGRRGRQTG